MPFIACSASGTLPTPSRLNRPCLPQVLACLYNNGTPGFRAFLSTGGASIHPPGGESEARGQSDGLAEAVEVPLPAVKFVRAGKVRTHPHARV
jgi:hypothetical protein